MNLRKPDKYRFLISIAAMLSAVPLFPERVAAQTYSILHSFGSVWGDGRLPKSSLIQGSDGNFYGTTYNGGSTGCGTVFEMTPAGDVTVLHWFKDGSVVGDGVFP